MSVEGKRIKSIAEAMEQNAEYFGFDLCDRIAISETEWVEIPYRELLTADVKKRVDAVYRDYEACERHITETIGEDGEITKTPGAHIVLGDNVRQRDGKPFDLNEQISIALWGQDKYDRFVAAGGPPGLVLITWGRMRHQVNRRLTQDPKSL